MTAGLEGRSARRNVRPLTLPSKSIPPSARFETFFYRILGTSAALLEHDFSTVLEHHLGNKQITR